MTPPATTSTASSAAPSATAQSRVVRLKTNDPESLLPRFGLTSFRPGQRGVVDALASGEDCLCVMPTGGGKSLCYQLPALAREGTTIVVSPLIALMKDQVDTLVSRGIRAKLINSSLSQAQQESVMDAMARGELDLVYVAPERLRNGLFLDAVGKADITLLAVDEAHCVSEWGHDFRPDYARLGKFRDRYLGGVQTIALTATATPTVRDDICELLNLKEPRVFVTGFARTNLKFGVESCNNDAAKRDTLQKYLRGRDGTGIIYAATRKRCEEIAEWLPEKTGRKVGAYHAGLHPDERRRIQESFMKGELSAIVATNAFGMGIDKSDIRFVVHFNIPGSLEAYYQEAGRAGRDGEMSDCLLLFAYFDRQIQEFFIENRYPSKETVKKVYEFLLSREEDPIELTLDQLRTAIELRDGTEAISTSETLLARAGVLKRLDAGSNQAIVRIDSDAPTMLDFLPREAKIKRRVMSAVEKVVGDRRGEDVYVRPDTLAKLADMDRAKVTTQLRELTKLRAFDYVPPFRGRAVHITRRDLRFEQLSIDFEELARRKAAEYEKLEAVIQFARAPACRQRVILDYFGDPNAADCTRCDRCDPVGGKLIRDGNWTGGNTGTAHVPTPSTSIAHPDIDERVLLTGVRVVLSGVVRTHGRLGKNLIAQMLAGSKNKRVTQLRLDRLSTYGMLTGMTQTELADVMDSLLSAGLLEQKEISERRPTVHMTEPGRRVMNRLDPLPAAFQLKHRLAKKLAKAASKIESGDVADDDSVDYAPATTSPTPDASTSAQTSAPVADPSRTREPQRNATPSTPAPPNSATHQSFEEPVQPVASAVSPATNASPDASPDKPSSLGGIDLKSIIAEDPEQILIRELTDRIKRFRRKRSAALGVSPHQILSGSTIERLAQSRPANATQLESVSGISDEFMEAYGSDLLELIATTMSQHEIDYPHLPPAPSQPDLPTASILPDPGEVELVLDADGSAGVEQHVRNVEPEPTGEESSVDDASIRADQQAWRTDYWTWRLCRDGYTLEQIAEIRGVSVEGLMAHLVAAARAGHTVDPAWGGTPDREAKLRRILA
ncbi:RecQ family ATP-dependent DNA helicase [Aporhodopirellula aestuarii]|uniref:ATP-dependent DNA helicase RecQ n=1 Tax=Aporhodopirellula aestuarii TaxID=2950107 RepID=A0ABT0U689_9BACT|nr:RecQ family ATP-dependent DNA helicase [Aporhodopirellula aestuarii]MCM2372436.1 RecQ family ATP-dependent DNA helicase [Aporhodopirellula aestuarii]